jgi:hypothetical protein
LSPKIGWIVCHRQPQCFPIGLCETLGSTVQPIWTDTTIKPEVWGPGVRERGVVKAQHVPPPQGFHGCLASTSHGWAIWDKMRNKTTADGVWWSAVTAIWRFIEMWTEWKTTMWGLIFYFFLPLSSQLPWSCMAAPLDSTASFWSTCYAGALSQPQWWMWVGILGCLK